MKYLKIAGLISVVMVLLACSVSVNVPTLVAGEEKTLTINEPLSSGVDLYKVEIQMGAGKLALAGGSSNLVEGKVVYNVDSWKPEVTRAADSVTIKQTNTSTVAIPDGNIKNQWNLKLGSMPLELTLATGASEGNLDLSGLSLTKLSISDGASKSTVRFDTANPEIMSLFSYTTGASTVDIIGLGNSNAQEITFEGGVGSYSLDFSGFVGHDVNVTIKTGVSDVKLIIPADAYVKVTNNGALSDIDVQGEWTVNNNVYTYGEHGPLISITVEMGVGSLHLVQQ